MNKTDLQKVRAALVAADNAILSVHGYNEALAILDRALAAPEQEPVVYWNGDRSVIPADEVSYIPNWTDYYPTPLYRHPAPQSQPIARVTGYYAGRCIIEPLDGKTVFSSGMAVYSAPVAAQPEQPMQWIDVSERVPDEAQIVLFVLRGKVVVGAWIAGIFWYDNAKQVATAWMPLPPPPEFGVGGYPVTAPPSREWQDLSPLEMRDTLRNCAASTFDKLAPNWYEVRQFARAIEAALRAKNTGEQA